MLPAVAEAIEPPVAAVGGGGERSKAVWVGGEDIGGKVAIDKRARGGDVFFEKGTGGETGGGRGDVDVLVVVDARESGDGRKAHIDANGGIERGGHRDIHVALAQVLGHLEDAAHAAERGGLDHGDVRCLQLGDAIRVGNLANGFISGNAYKEAGAHKAATDLGELLSGGARLFHIIQRHHHLRGLDRLIDAPAAVGVHAQDRDFAALGDGVADGADASGVVGKRVPLLRHLDFEGAAAGVALHHGRNLAGGHGRNGGVDLDRIAHRLRKTLVCGLEPGAQPSSGLGRSVLQEGREFAPAGWAIDEQGLPGGDAAETHGEGEGNYVGAVEDVIDMHGLHGSFHLEERSWWCYVPTMLYLLISLLAIAAVVYLIYKKVHAATAIFAAGVILLMLAALTGRAEFRTTEIEATGNSFYDQLLVIDALFKERFSGIGMAIMVLFGFVSYMRHIGADAKTVVVLSSPLKRFKGSYWLVPVGFILGSLLSLVIPSAAALSLLLVATLLPALIAAGLTPLTVAAIVVTSSTIMPTPLEAGLIQGADLTDMTVTEFVYGSVAYATVPTLLVTAFVHMWWQRHCDKQEESSGSTDAGLTDAATEQSIARAATLPGYYAVLPLLPLLLIVVSAVLERVGVLSFEAGILPVTVVSLFIAMSIESIRHRTITGAIDSAAGFFKGMGEGAAGVVALLVAAAVLVEGITQMGVIDMLISTAENSSGAAVFIVLIFVAATAAMAALTGSGTAPYFAFSEVVPNLASQTSIHAPQMLTAIWGTSNLMRQVSPVNAAILIVAGAIDVNPIRLVKRTAVPMIVATVLNTLFAFMFIS